MGTHATKFQPLRIYCILPSGLRCALYEPLREWFAGASNIEVLVERRSCARRTRPYGVGNDWDARTPRDRRGRDRRRRVRLAVEAPGLPLAATAHPGRLLFVRAAGAEATPFDELYASYYGVLHRHLCYGLGRPDDADDLTQTVLTNAFDALSRGDRPVDAIEPWLFKIAHNVLLKHIQKHMPVTVSDTYELDRHREARGCVEPPELGWLTQPRLLASFAALSDFQQRVLVLRFKFDLSRVDIARLLESTPTSVASTQSEAMRKLRSRLTAGGGQGTRAAFGSSRLPTSLHRVRGRSISVLPRTTPRQGAWGAAPKRF